jgi:nitrilase
VSTYAVAVVQAGSELFDTPRTMDKAVRLVTEAAGQGAQLVVLPEAFIGGYPKGLDFGVRIGMRSDAGRDEFRRYHDGAITVPGPETERLGELAGQLSIHLIAGVIERDGGTLYCTAVFLGPDGSLLGKHRKLMPTAAERVIWGTGDGSTMPVFAADEVRFGAAICWENYMPLFRTAMYDKRIDLWCAPTVDERETWQATMRHIALEGRCFVLSACQYLTRANLPTDVHPAQGDDPDTVLIGGGSVIVGPLGDVLAGPLRGQEGILRADLDLDDLARARFDFDAVGHYARPDVFTLHVNETRQRAVDTGR